MWYINIYSNLKVYQKYRGTSIKVGCATRSLYASSGPKAEGVPTNNQRGRGSGPCRFWGGLDKARHIVPTALLVRVQRLRNDLYKAVKGQAQEQDKSSDINFNFVGLLHHPFWIHLVYALSGIHFQLLNPHCLTKDHWWGTVPEMRIWSILLIHSDLKWCIHLSRSLFLYIKQQRQWDRTRCLVHN